MDSTQTPPAPQRTLITTRREYLDAVDRLLAMAKRELRVFDPDLETIDFNAPGRVAVLRSLLAANRNHRVRIALHDVEHVRRRCPRLLNLISTFPTALLIHLTEGQATRAQDCFLIADGENLVRRPAATQYPGVLLLDDPDEGHGMQERFEQIWESSRMAVTATTVGL